MANEKKKIKILCLDFDGTLVESNNIKGNTRLDYQKMKNCFIKPDGTKFTEVFKSLKQSIEINLAEDKRTQIDELIIETERHHYTDAYIKLTEAFYLKM